MVVFGSSKDFPSSRSKSSMVSSGERLVANLYYLSQTKRYLNYVYEISWLFTLMAIPLMFNGKNEYFNFTQPKQHVLHIMALMVVVFLVFELAATLVVKRPTKKSVIGFVKNPHGFAIIMLGAFTLAHILSLAFSPSPFISLIGRDANDPGNDFYTTISYLIFTFLIALKVRKVAQFERILMVIAGVGVITAFYGLAQLLGESGDTLCTGSGDIIGCGSGFDRVYSSFGNPIFFSAYLLFSTLATIALTWRYSLSLSNRFGKPGLYMVVGLGMSLAIFQSLMSYSTTSRGPIVGLFAAFFVAVAITVLVNSNRTVLLKMGVVIVMTIAMWLLLWLSSDSLALLSVVWGLFGLFIGALVYLEYKAGLSYKSSIVVGVVAMLGLVLSYLFVLNDIFGVLYDFVVIFVPFASASTVLVSRQITKLYGVALFLFLGAAIVLYSFLNFHFNWLTNDDRLYQDAVVVNTQSTDTALSGAEVDLFSDFDELSSGRLSIWLGALRTVQTRALPTDYDTTPLALRHIFGLGQEMYAAAYPITIEPRPTFSVAANAHNLPLHILVEQGIFGLMTFVALLAAVGFSIYKAITSHAKREHTVMAVAMAIVLAGALTGRYFEQMFGLARISDNFTVWALIGVAIALSAKDFDPKEQINTQTPSVVKKRDSLGVNGQNGANKSKKPALPLLSFLWQPLVAGSVVLALALGTIFVLDIRALGVSTSAIQSFDDSVQARATYQSSGQGVDEFVASSSTLAAASIDQPQSELYLIQYVDIVKDVIPAWIGQPQNWESVIQVLDDFDGAWQGVNNVKSGAYNSDIVGIFSLLQRRALIRQIDLAGTPEEVADIRGRALGSWEDVAAIEEEVRKHADFLIDNVPVYTQVIEQVARAYITIGDYTDAASSAVTGISIANEVGNAPWQFYEIEVAAKTNLGRDSYNDVFALITEYIEIGDGSSDYNRFGNSLNNVVNEITTTYARDALTLEEEIAELEDSSDGTDMADLIAQKEGEEKMSWDQVRIWAELGIELSTAISSETPRFFEFSWNADFQSQDLTGTIDVIERVVALETKDSDYIEVVTKAREFTDFIAATSDGDEDFALLERANALTTQIDEILAELQPPENTSDQ